MTIRRTIRIINLILPCLILALLLFNALGCEEEKDVQTGTLSLTPFDDSEYVVPAPNIRVEGTNEVIIKDLSELNSIKSKIIEELGRQLDECRAEKEACNCE